MINSVMTTRTESDMSRNPLFVANRIKEKTPKNNQKKMAGGTRNKIKQKVHSSSAVLRIAIVGFYQTNLHLIHKDQKVFQSAHTKNNTVFSLDGRKQLMSVTDK